MRNKLLRILYCALKKITMKKYISLFLILISITACQISDDELLDENEVLNEEELLDIEISTKDGADLEIETSIENRRSSAVSTLGGINGIDGSSEDDDGSPDLSGSQFFDLDYEIPLPSSNVSYGEFFVVYDASLSQEDIRRIRTLTIFNQNQFGTIDNIRYNPLQSFPRDHSFYTRFPGQHFEYWSVDVSYYDLIVNQNGRPLTHPPGLGGPRGPGPCGLNPAAC